MASEFVKELEALINKYSLENSSNAPDFLLAAFLVGCLAQFNRAVNRREIWYGRKAPLAEEPDVSRESLLGTL